MQTGFSAADVILIIAALTTLVAGLGVAIVNVVVAVRTKTKVDEVIVKADNIAGHVNGAAGIAAERADSLQRELELMRRLFAEQKESAAVLASRAERLPGQSRVTDTQE